MSYGITTTGFVRKPLSVILSEIEVALVARFGPGVIQTSQSPLGQLNGLFADLATDAWEIGEDVYQSLDPDQAEGINLDRIGRIRGVTRPVDEEDAAYRRRITNGSRSDIYIRPVIEAVEAVAGVSCVRVWVNDTDTTSGNGIPSHSIAVAVVGGDNAAVGLAIHQWTVAGVGLYGNTNVVFNDAGLCRTLTFLRPTAVPIRLEVTVAASPTMCACRAPTIGEIRDAITTNLACSSDCGLGNGDDITSNRIVAALAGVDGAEVISVIGSRAPTGDLGAMPIVIAFNEIATIDPANIAVVYA